MALPGSERQPRALDRVWEFAANRVLISQSPNPLPDVCPRRLRKEDPALSTQTIPTAPKPAFLPGRRSAFKIIQPATTYSGSPIVPVQKGLPRNTQSLCPECSELIEAMLFED